MKQIRLGLAVLLASALPAVAVSAEKPIEAGLELQALCFDTKADPAKVRDVALKRGYSEPKPGVFEITAPYAATLTLGQEHVDKSKSQMLGAIDLQSCRLVFHGGPAPSQEALMQWFRWKEGGLPWSGYISTSHSRIDMGGIKPFWTQPSLAAGNAMGYELKAKSLGLLVARLNDRNELDLYFGQVSQTK